MLQPYISAIKIGAYTILYPYVLAIEELKSFDVSRLDHAKRFGRNPLYKSFSFMFIAGVGIHGSVPFEIHVFDHHVLCPFKSERKRKVK